MLQGLEREAPPLDLLLFLASMHERIQGESQIKGSRNLRFTERQRRKYTLRQLQEKMSIVIYKIHSHPFIGWGGAHGNAWLNIQMGWSLGLGCSLEMSRHLVRNGK